MPSLAPPARPHAVDTPRGSGNGINSEAMELLSPGLAQLPALESLDL